MIKLDITSLNDTNDEIYSVERGSKVRVLLNGELLKGCIYCNVSKGVAICVKRDLSSGMVMVAENSIVYELVFGFMNVENVSVNPIPTETDRRDHAIKVASSRPEDYDWFDSCRPDDRD